MTYLFPLSDNKCTNVDRLFTTLLQITLEGVRLSKNVLKVTGRELKKDCLNKIEKYIICMVRKGELYLSIKYTIFNSMHDADVLDGILELHKDIFGTSDDLMNKMRSKPQLLVITAMDENKVIGYKIGYALDSKKFYSWLGGVETNFRKYGIASRLMEMQHQYLKENGYNVVQTKTMNKWRNMLVLNIKNGFDVIDTYIDEKGLHKIILEKNLLN